MNPGNQEVFISNELLRESSDEELRAALTETQQKLLELRSEDSLGRVWNPKRPHLAKGYKKLIARIKTVLRERGYR